MSENKQQPDVELEIEQAPLEADNQIDAAAEGELLQPDVAYVAELEQQLAAANERAQAEKDQALRALAEMENLRRRAAQDVEKAQKFALEKFAGDLLPVIDSLERP